MMSPYGELFCSSAENKEDAEVEVLQKQNSMTDPYPLALLERAGGDWLALFQVFANMDIDQREHVSPCTPIWRTPPFGAPHLSDFPDRHSYLDN